ncbi:MAG: pyridoxal phosphate-dependent aminotransferase [Acidobacteria bacterium]|nr:pyridoxal phosphate-dependent aminotransferase [Acidobacteriota bacterium]MCG3191506.1 Aspartate aminotransferase [Thermoanaerobaculia bacterium]MCK6682831.1 pyridoxal phosphate-dependent aminotransferase [Thermoanaerobaculia bacterium]
MPPSPIRKLAPLANAAKSRGVKVYHLNIGQPDLETPEPIRARLSTITEKTYAYSPSEGTPEYLDSLRQYYHKRGIDLKPGQIIATTGGSEAVQFALMAVGDPGDEVMVVEPFYTNYRSFAAMAGMKLNTLTAHGDDGFHAPPLSVWEKALTEKTRAVLLCNPSNPTGTVFSREEVVMVAQFCRDHGLFLISDEVYREFVYDGREATSALNLAGFEEIVIVVDSLSKRYSACGIRLGSIASRNSEVMDTMNRLAMGRLSPPGLAQRIAPGALLLGPEYTEGVVTEYQKRRDILCEGLGKIPGVFVRKPEGAFYMVVRLPIEDSEDFAAWLLTSFSYNGSTVMVAPAPGFYATEGLGKDEVRIAYVLKQDDLEASIDILAHALTAYRQARGLPAL